MNLYAFTDSHVHNNGKLEHTYNCKVVTDEYLKCPASCTNRAIYYYSCECGAIGEDTFEYGEPLHHNINQTNYICHNCGARIDGLMNSNYGYEYLTTHFHNGDMVAFYHDLNEACFSFFCSKEDMPSDEIARVNYSSYGLSLDEALTVTGLLFHDCPLYYWLAHGIDYDSSDVVLLIENEYYSWAARSVCNDYIFNTIDELSKLNFYEKADYYTSILLHDYINESIDYKYDDEGNPSMDVEAHNIIGALSKRGGVCESYAKTFQLLLNYYGIENIYVVGESQGTGHAWNLVSIDNQWYWYDLTFDESSSWTDGIGYFFAYNYFWSGKSDGEFTTKHRITEESKELGLNYQYELPERGSVDYVENHEGYIGQEFTIGDITYTVCGARKAEIKYINKGGDVILPETIYHRGTRYTCVSIGNWDNFLWRSISVFGKEDIRSLYIPKTINYIWARTITNGANIENYYVNEDNPTFKAVDGVLYTKNGEILIAYPSKNSRTDYQIIDSCKATLSECFGKENNLTSLYVGKDCQYFGIINQFAMNYMIIMKESGEFNRIVDSMKDGGRIIFDTDNIHFYSDDYAIYSLWKHFFDDNHPSFIEGDESTYNYGAKLECIYKSEADSFTINKEIVKNGIHFKIFDADCGCLVSGTYGYAHVTAFERFDNVIINNNEYFVIKDGILYQTGYKAWLDSPSSTSPIAVISKEKNVTMLEGAMNTNGLFTTSNALETVVLANGQNVINFSEFFACENLITITIPNTVAIIDEYAFYGCNSLSTINFGGTMEEWNNIDIRSESVFDYNKNPDLIVTKTITVYCTDGVIVINR